MQISTYSSIGERHVNGVEVEIIDLKRITSRYIL
jgi:hypothetical protein